MNLDTAPSHQHRGGQLVRQGLRTSACAVMTALALTGCGPNHTTPPPSTSAAPPASSSPSPSPSPTGAGAPTAMDAYRGMWRAYVQAIRIPDPNYPMLARYAEGDALKVFVKGLTSTKNNGLVGRGDVVLHPAVTAANPDLQPPTVEIKDCVDTSATHLMKKDGSPYHDTPGGKRAAKATVSRLPDGSWRVSAFALFAVGTC